MCGIAGIYRFDSEPVDPESLRRMTDSLRHRGPDGEGHRIQGRAGLGHRRLSIIDLSQRGTQPMSNEDGTIWVTYNGEIYNFPELRADLLERGHRFNSETDTEVIVHLYEEEGVDCLKHFNGMFAFALWDSRTGTLLLARDRIGIKPLFYAVDRQKLLFGSEIKAILSGSAQDWPINFEALHHFLSFNYMPAPLTMFEGVKQLLPGQYLLVEGSRVSLHEYWDLRFSEDGSRADEAQYVDRLDWLLRGIVERMLVSDVPFGAFLSGGIDSSTVTYLMSQILSDPVKTFSIGFDEASYNELDYARMAARRFQSDHHEDVVTPDGLDELLPTLVWHAEEPTADASMVPLYYVSQLARRHVTMVLSGDGSDELFAGYETYSAYYAAHLYRMLAPRMLRQRILSPMIERLPVSDAKLSLGFKAQRFVRGADLPPERGHAYWRLILDEHAKRDLYSDELRERLAGVDTFAQTYERYFGQTNARSPLNRMLYVDTRFYLPNDMLVKVDRMSMAHSLEVRVPFLDHELVEFLATVPPSLKLRYFMNKKYLLKKLMQSKLPDRVLSRSKQGFNIPVGKWIREPLRDFVRDVLSERAVRRIGLFKPEKIGRLLSDHFERRVDNGYQIWGLMVFFLWWEAFVERQYAISSVAVTSVEQDT